MSSWYLVITGHLKEESIMNIDVLRTYAVRGRIFEISLLGFGKLKIDFGLNREFFQL